MCLLSSLEVLYEDLHFVAVFFAFLTAVSAFLICLMWLCNKSVHLLQRQRSQLKGNRGNDTNEPKNQRPNIHLASTRADLPNPLYLGIRCILTEESVFCFVWLPYDYGLSTILVVGLWELPLNRELVTCLDRWRQVTLIQGDSSSTPGTLLTAHPPNPIHRLLLVLSSEEPQLSDQLHTLHAEGTTLASGTCRKGWKRQNSEEIAAEPITLIHIILVRHQANPDIQQPFLRFYT